MGKGKSLQDTWEEIRGIELSKIDSVNDKFVKFVKQPIFHPDVHYGWLQLRMGLFSHGNTWLPVTCNSESPDFTKFQDAYRALFGSEASVNFNLSRAALYSRQHSPAVRRASALLISLKNIESPFEVKIQNNTFEFVIGLAISDLLLPVKLFVDVNEQFTIRCNDNRAKESPDFDLLLRLDTCRKHAFYEIQRKWANDGATGINDENRFPTELLRLAIFLFTLEVQEDNGKLLSRWRKVRDRFLAKSPEELLQSTISVLQGALFWLRFASQQDNDGGAPWLLNLLMPLKLGIKDISKIEALQSRFKNNKKIVLSLYNQVRIPPDIIAFAGIGQGYKKVLREIDTSFRAVILEANLTLLNSVLTDLIQDNHELYAFENYFKGFASDEQLAELKKRFAIPLKKLTLCTLFPVDQEQFKYFLDFCLTKLPVIAKYEGRPLRFSLVLGNELHLNMYFGDDSASRSDFAVDRKGDKIVYDLSDKTHISQALARIKGNAGLFQLRDHHLFCHAGMRHKGTTLEISYVVREHPFIQKAPIGNLTTFEVLPNGEKRILSDGIEECRISHGEWRFPFAEETDKLRDSIANLLCQFSGQNVNGNGLKSHAGFYERIDILLRALQRLRDRSQGGTLILCHIDDFDKWRNPKREAEVAGHNALISRQTPSISGWDELPIADGVLAILTELLAQDGATFVVADSDGAMLASGKYILHPIYRENVSGAEKSVQIRIFSPDDFLYKGEKITVHWNELGWENWQATYYKWGTRHLSAIAFSALAGNKALAIAVSADGDISYFYDGCYWDTSRFAEKFSTSTKCPKL